MGDLMKTKNMAWVVIGLLTACTDHIGTPEITTSVAENHFGEAISQNTAAQIANPEAPASRPLEASGTRAAAAIQRYRTDTVEKPMLPNTQKSVDVQ